MTHSQNKSMIEREGNFEIWSKKKLIKGMICNLGNIKFKIIKCKYLKKQKVYATLCLNLKRIAILTPTFNYYSGVDRLAENIAIETNKIGHDVTVFTWEEQIK